MSLSPDHVAIAFVVALVAGAFGAVLGIGGGLFIIPSLTLFLGVDLKTAIATSIVAIIATSVGGGNVYLRSQVADMRLGLLLALATVPGAIVGALLTTFISARVLAAVFAAVLAATAYRLLSTARAPNASPDVESDTSTPALVEGAYFEASKGEVIRYRVHHLGPGIAISCLAGLISGLLGVGGGIIQVPVMTLLMRVPIKVATTTSTYVIGITGMAGAFVYYNHRPSFVDPSLAVPVTIGVFLGASVGSRILRRVSQTALRNTFTAVVAIYTVQMALRVFGIGGG